MAAEFDGDTDVGAGLTIALDGRVEHVRIELPANDDQIEYLPTCRQCGSPYELVQPGNDEPGRQIAWCAECGKMLLMIELDRTAQRWVVFPLPSREELAAAS